MSCRRFALLRSGGLMLALLVTGDASAELPPANLDVPAPAPDVDGGETLDAAVVVDCEDTTESGCCDGDTVRFCGPGGPDVIVCGALAVGQRLCGWDPTEGRYDCGGTGLAAPGGDPRYSCDPSPCAPSCEGRVCGPDGCGGSCGRCDGDAVCVAESGQCVDGCARAPEAGCCHGSDALRCVGSPGASLVVRDDCALRGLECGWLEEAGIYACASEGAVDPSGARARECPRTCEPSCPEGACGDDGCGGSCGPCPPDSGAAGTFDSGGDVIDATPAPITDPGDPFVPPEVHDRFRPGPDLGPVVITSGCAAGAPPGAFGWWWLLAGAAPALRTRLRGADARARRGLRARTPR